MCPRTQAGAIGRRNRCWICSTAAALRARQDVPHIPAGARPLLLALPRVLELVETVQQYCFSNSVVVHYRGSSFVRNSRVTSAPDSRLPPQSRWLLAFTGGGRVRLRASKTLARYASSVARAGDRWAPHPRDLKVVSAGAGVGVRAAALAVLQELHVLYLHLVVAHPALDPPSPSPTQAGEAALPYPSRER